MNIAANGAAASASFRREVEYRLAPFFKAELGGSLTLDEEAVVRESAPPDYQRLLSRFLSDKRAAGDRRPSSLSEFSLWADRRRLRFAASESFFEEAHALVDRYGKQGMSTAAARLRADAPNERDRDHGEFMQYVAALLDRFMAERTPEVKTATTFSYWMGKELADAESMDAIAAAYPSMSAAYLNLQERSREGLTRLADQSVNNAKGGFTGDVEPVMGTENPGTRVLGPDLADRAAGRTAGGEKVFPSAREVSERLAKVGAGNASPKSETLTQWVMQWGQFVDHDFALFPENGARPRVIQNEDSSSIFIFEADAVEDSQGRKTVPNNITGFIDASNVYGSDELRTALLREPPGLADGTPKVGRMRTSVGASGEILPPTTAQYLREGLHIESDPGDVLVRTADGLRAAIAELEAKPGSDCDPAVQEQLKKLRAELTRTEAAIGKTFVAGDVRVSEQPGLTAVHTLLLREHNRVADKTAARFLAEGPDAWQRYFDTLEKFDEFVFTYARNYVTGVVQQITFHEWLPALIGAHNSIGDYEFDPQADPRQHREFAAALFRIGHTLVPDELLRIEEDGDVERIGLREAFFRPELATEKGVDGLMRGLTAPGERFDPKVVDSLREFLFKAHQGDETLEIRMDLIATNLLRGRELEIASYNELREVHGLERYTRFDQVSDDPDVVEGLRQLYHRDGLSEAEAVDRIEAWIGAVSEKHAPNSEVGELIAAAFKDRFTQLQNGDRFNFNHAGEFPDLATAALEARRRRNAGASSFKFLPGDQEEIRSTRLFDLAARNGVRDLPADQPNLFKQAAAQ